MKRFFNLSKLFLVLSLLPASASAITITISAPNDASTTLDVTMTGDIILNYSSDNVYFQSIGDYVTSNGPDGEKFDLTSGITANGTAVTRVALDYDNNFPNDDDFRIYGSFSAISYSFSGSATIDLLEEGSFNFGHLINGIYSLDVYSPTSQVLDIGHSLVIQYSSVPDTGSTAALLGAGVVALVFARRRLG